MFYIMSGGMLIEQGQSCPTEDDLRELAEECGLDDMWVIDGEHSGITWNHPDPNVLPTQTIIAPGKRRIVFGQTSTYPA